MKARVVVPTARRHVIAIAGFIAAGNPDAAERYIDVAYQTFFGVDENRMPARASEKLPRDVRKLMLPGFRGYSLRLFYRAEHIVLLAAFRPGLSTTMQDRETRTGLRDYRREYP